MDLKDPTTAALASAEALDRAGIPHAIYGGLLMAAYGEPRETRDADLAVADLSASTAQRALADLGLETSIVFEEMRFGGLVLSRLALLGGEGWVGLNVLDLVRPLSARYRAAALERAPMVPMRTRQVRVLTPEDFILFKLLATRDRDLEDAVSVWRRTGEHLDRALVRAEVSRLAQEVPDWDIAARLRAAESRA